MRSALNEGRGANPGDTVAGGDRDLVCRGRSTKAGARTPATHEEVPVDRAALGVRSTKAGARTPATLAGGDRDLVRRGRSTKAGARTPATHDGVEVGVGEGGRSTKAGARTPATHARGTGEAWPLDCAQRRPGREPRRHGDPLAPVVCRVAPLNEGRGANPGDTHRCSSASHSAHVPLNEGRGANPGDTHGHRGMAGPRRRSTKAGARTPATRLSGAGRVPGLGRSTKAGARTPATPPLAVKWFPDRCPAQRRPGREPRRHPVLLRANQRFLARSTKAGARTPATLVSPELAECLSSVAQRRPGREPRRHARAAARAPKHRTTAQRRPGREPRRHVVRRVRVGATIDRSTKAGARTPATHADWIKTVSTTGSAQRRPGREPRRHWTVVRPRTGSADAQRRPGREPRRHFGAVEMKGPGRSRSTKAGARTPATPART